MFLRALVSSHRERKSSSNKMAPGLNQMVARQSKWPSEITTQNTELKHTCINLAVLIRHSLKHKNTVSQKTYRDTELQIQVLTLKGKYLRSSKISEGGKEARLKEERGGGGKGCERGGLTDVSCHLQTPGPYGTFPWASREGRAGSQPSQKWEPKFEFSAKSR